jgi:hypothetical protein
MTFPRVLQFALVALLVQRPNPFTPTKLVDVRGDSTALTECPCHLAPTNRVGGVTSCDVEGTQLDPPLPPSPDGVERCPCHRIPVRTREDGTIECAEKHTMLGTPAEA